MHVLINKSRTAWSSEIVMPFVSFSDILLQDNHVYQKNDFEIVQKKKKFVWGTVLVNCKNMNRFQFCLNVKKSLHIFLNNSGRTGWIFLYKKLI